MSTVYLNGEFLPAEQARISPMDRGFLFGDGIYEVIPSYDGHFIGFGPHIKRMHEGLGVLSIDDGLTEQQWLEISRELLTRNPQLGPNVAVYFQVSRGTDIIRNHAYPQNIKPTIFGFAFTIASAPVADKAQARTYTVVTGNDLRWQRCHIKSTSLLGNVIHYQQGHDAGAQEILLFDRDGNLTEGSSVNAFIVKDGVIATPPLSNKILPGITRYVLLSILAKYSDIKVEEREISKEEVLAADEVWITSSSKEVAPVISIDGKPVGSGTVGDVWLQAQTLFTAHKFEF